MWGLCAWVRRGANLIPIAQQTGMPRRARAQAKTWGGFAPRCPCFSQRLAQHAHTQQEGLPIQERHVGFPAASTAGRVQRQVAELSARHCYSCWATQLCWLRPQTPGTRPLRRITCPSHSIICPSDSLVCVRVRPFFLRATTPFVCLYLMCCNTDDPQGHAHP